MSHELVKIFGIIGVFFVPAAVVITFFVLRHRQRMELLRRGIDPESNLPRYPKRTPLLLGLLFSGLGTAFIAGWFSNMSDDGLKMMGFICLGLGIAFLVYWKLTAPDRERQLRFYEEWMAAKIKEMEHSLTAVSSDAGNVEKDVKNEEEKPRDADSL